MFYGEPSYMESRGEPPPLIWTVRSKSNLTAVHKQCSIRKLTLSLSRSVRYFRYLPLFHLSLSLYLARFLISRDCDLCSPSRFLSISQSISHHPRAESLFLQLRRCQWIEAIGYGDFVKSNCVLLESSSVFL